MTKQKLLPKAITNHSMYPAVSSALDEALNSSTQDTRVYGILSWLRGISAVERESEFSNWVIFIMLKIRKARS